MDDCVRLARRAGNEIWRLFQIPVYFYGAAATRAERAELENVRRGEFEALRKEVLTDPSRAPDIGGRLHSSAGAVAVGARKILIAYNLNLTTADANVAKEIARTIRASSGGLPFVKAIGIDLQRKGLAQVSINLTDFERTPLRLVFERVREEARRRGCAIAGAEIVGLAPRKALEDVDAEGLPSGKLLLLEERLSSALAAESVSRILEKESNA